MSNTWVSKLKIDDVVSLADIADMEETEVSLADEARENGLELPAAGVVLSVEEDENDPDWTHVWLLIAGLDENDDEISYESLSILPRDLRVTITQ